MRDVRARRGGRNAAPGSHWDPESADFEPLPLESGRRVVVDASVISKWFVPEPNCEGARRLVGGAYEVFVPDLAFTELGSILEKRVAGMMLTDAEALSILQAVSKMPLQIHRTWSLGPIALELRRSIDVGMYECIHLALALREGAILVTADRRLYQTLNRTMLSQYVCWIDDVPTSTIAC